MDINAISALSLQPLKFMSSIKDTGSDITVANKLHTNTTISSDGNILITWICKMLWTSRRYSTASRRPPMTHFNSDELREKWTERVGDWDVVYIYIYIYDCRAFIENHCHCTNIDTTMPMILAWVLELLKESFSILFEAPL